MKNPWLNIPLSDYEAHMALPGVAQAQLLAEILAGQLQSRQPSSLAVIGCAGGNGFERIAPEVTRRVVGVDLNGRFLEEVRTRYENQFERLELVEGDLLTNAVAFTPVNLVLERQEQGMAHWELESAQHYCSRIFTAKLRVLE
jgi:hypothetical protein